MFAFVIAVFCYLALPTADVFSRKLRQRGYPTSLAELDAWYPAVPAAENAAFIYTNAFALLVNYSNYLGGAWLPSIGQGFSEQQKADLACVFEANSAALDLLHSVPAFARSRYPLDLREGYTLALTHLVKTKQAVLLLGSEALFAADAGDAEAATQSLLAAGRVTESVGTEPLLISQKVRAMNWSTLLARLERALSLTAFSESQLAALQEQVRAAERPDAAVRGWVTEWVAGKTLFEDRRIMDSALKAQSFLAPKSPGGQLAGLSPWARNGCMNLWRAAGQQEKDKAFFLNYVEQRVIALELPYPARFEALQRLAAVTNRPSRFSVFSQMLFTALPLLDWPEAEHAARIRVAVTVLAIERFRLANGGELPESLTELVPTFLDEPLLDPFNGHPLRYKNYGGRYVVYSLGGDCEDNGGAVWDTECVKSVQDIAVAVRH